MLAVINNFNLLTWPRAMADWLSRESSLEIVILDNNSTYSPLLRWYEDCPYQVVRLKANSGHLAPWTTGLIRDCAYGGQYIVTDPDLDLSGIPDDWLSVLRAGLGFSGVIKCGFSLRLDDLPEAPNTPWILQDQERWWAKPFQGDACYVMAGIDTTLAVYQANSPHGVPPRPGQLHLRAGPPYTARHLPWYLLPGQVPEEYNYYIRHSGQISTVASRWRRSGWLRR